MSPGLNVLAYKWGQKSQPRELLTRTRGGEVHEDPPPSPAFRSGAREERTPAGAAETKLEINSQGAKDEPLLICAPAPQWKILRPLMPRLPSDFPEEPDSERGLPQWTRGS